MTPNIARIPVFQRIVAAQTVLRDRLLERLKIPWQRLEQQDEPGLTRIVPALAAVVLDRASPDRRRIAREMRGLREELAPVRARLREAEFNLQCETAWEGGKRIAAWQRAFAELQSDFGASRYSVSAESVLSVIPVAAAAAGAPHLRVAAQSAKSRPEPWRV
jgi:hypothetical protein